MELTTIVLLAALVLTVTGILVNITKIIDWLRREKPEE